MRFLTKFLVICGLKDPFTLNYRWNYITMFLVMSGLSILLTFGFFNACNQTIEELAGVETFTKEEIEASKQLNSFYDQLIGEISEHCLQSLERDDYECLCLEAVIRDTPQEVLLDFSVDDIKNDRIASISEQRRDCEISLSGTRGQGTPIYLKWKSYSSESTTESFELSLSGFEPYSVVEVNLVFEGAGLFVQDGPIATVPIDENGQATQGFTFHIDEADTWAIEGNQVVYFLQIKDPSDLSIGWIFKDPIFVLTQTEKIYLGDEEIRIPR